MPFEKMTRVTEVASSERRPIPIVDGIHDGRGDTWKSRSHSALSPGGGDGGCGCGGGGGEVVAAVAASGDGEAAPSTDHGCGGNMSVTLFAAIGWTICAGRLREIAIGETMR